jgi:chitinase
VILAFTKTQDDGIIIVDDANFPSLLVDKWQSSGKKVIFSVGGQSGIWSHVFASKANSYNFLSSMASILNSYNLDGVNLDIDDYQVAPRTFIDAIIIISPEDVTMIQSVAFVPTLDTPGQPWNYFVPVVNFAGPAIDYYLPQAFGNGYDSYAGASVTYLQDLYLNWRNLPSGGSTIPGFKGVDGKKLLIGLEASPSAGG